MNIESKRYKLTSEGNTAFLMAKSSGRAYTCPVDRLPSLARLSAMSEHQFDIVMQKEMS